LHGHWAKLREHDSWEMDFVLENISSKHVIWGSVKRNFTSLGAEGKPFPKQVYDLLHFRPEKKLKGEENKKKQPSQPILAKYQSFKHSFVFVGVEEPALKEPSESARAIALEAIQKTKVTDKNGLKEVARYLNETKISKEVFTEALEIAHNILEPERIVIKDKQSVVQKVSKYIQSKQEIREYFKKDVIVCCYVMKDLLEL
jgi:hypothetical protein